MTSTVLKTRDFTKFRTSTGNTFLGNDHHYWFLPVLRPDASAPVVVKNESPNLGGCDNLCPLFVKT